MAETTVLRSSASPIQAAKVTASAAPHTQLSGPLPIVNVTMGGGGKPAVTNGRQSAAPRNVTVFPVRGRIGALPDGAGAPLLAPMPLSNGDLLFCKALIEHYIGEQKDDEEGKGKAQLAKATLDAVELALAIPQPPMMAQPRVVSVGTARAPAGSSWAAPRRVQAAGQPAAQEGSDAAPRSVPPMIQVDMRR